MLRLRNLGNLGLGDPGTMNITVVDDNSKNRITIFEQSCLHVPGQHLQDYQIVECYSSSSDCNSQTNGVSVRAIDCCNRTGGGYIRHSSQCGGCIGK